MAQLTGRRPLLVLRLKALADKSWKENDGSWTKSLSLDHHLSPCPAFSSEEDRSSWKGNEEEGQERGREAEDRAGGGMKSGWGPKNINKTNRKAWSCQPSPLQLWTKILRHD